jgi:dTDP-4-dehydrorhamnose 3,5-epimerase-like enzyme
MEMNFKTPEILTGENYADERGELFYNNDFDLSAVKRMYIIKHHDKSIVRAWQGHRREHKFFKCIKGSFVISWKKIDDFTNPTDNNIPEHTILKKTENKVLSIPPGYANGFKALESDSELMVFSDHYLADCADDNIRFGKDLWIDWEQFQTT